MAYGLRPIELLHKHSVLGSHVLLHHVTLVSEAEIELIVETDTAVSYNPLASIWKGNAVAPALRFAQRGVRFGMGSDTTSADGFKNLMAAEACQRVEHGLPIADFSVGLPGLGSRRQLLKAQMLPVARVITAILKRVVPRILWFWI